uniref:Probable alginate O-acetylase AlgI n=1 Tax=Rubrivivax gelatinosus S1 TaxID=1138313 RepID=L8BAG9_RUBGE|nr:Membrane bound O-acyl transferase MBOAT family protein [Rubrivivax gelatinosus S1]
MLFTSSTFFLVFLPIVLAGYFGLGHRSPAAAAAWLFAASVFFYGYWMPALTLLLLASITVNFVIGLRIGRSLTARPAAARVWLVAGVVFNLGLLGYFKYANFFVDNLNAVLGSDWSIGRVVLPIGISFYSFTQIAFLVDTWKGKVNEYRGVHYGLFVTYFPHLVAGPVLHHAQMMPQFADPAVYRPDAGRLLAGLAIFTIGLAKKVVLADGVAPYADAVFHPVDHLGSMPTAPEAWLAALAYTFQLYFDFSGYSDMAIGLSWMFNIRLPFNFDSPYKSTSITEFWRRWHISLSTFLRDYLYIALGGNRKGPFRRYLNLAATMVLGGLWHGASWSFVLWGALHGAYLVANHGFRALCERLGWAERLSGHRGAAAAAWALTFLCVVLAWVFFRAQTLDGAVRVLSAMVSFDSLAAPQVLLWNAGLSLQTGLGWCALLAAVALLGPNSNLIGERLLRSLAASRPRRPLVGGAVVLCACALVVLNAARDTASAFIYFNF